MKIRYRVYVELYTDNEEFKNVLFWGSIPSRDYATQEEAVNAITWKKEKIKNIYVEKIHVFDKKKLEKWG